jgi:integrase
MACIRKRRGTWVVDYRDSAGVRRWVTCETRRAAEAILEEKLRESRQPSRPAVDVNITLADYAAQWRQVIEASIKPRTRASYEQILRLHIVPAFGAVKVRQLQKGRVKAFLAEKLASGLARNSVRIIHATLRAMLNAAVDDGLILGNPADRLGRRLRLVQRPAERRETIKALTREQLAHFLATAAATDRRHAPLFLLMARTGLRLGEALGLQWEDLDLGRRTVRVARALSAGRVETPKSGHGRTVDMSQQLARTLLRLQMERKPEALRRGWPELPPWIFCSEAGTPLDPANVDKAFKRVLKSAGLPLHFSPHGLRHTFASLLLQQGESPAYVQRQLGHASIQLTVDTYGRWLPMGNQAAVDRLDESSGSKMVAKAESGDPGVPEPPDLNGEP